MSFDLVMFTATVCATAMLTVALMIALFFLPGELSNWRNWREQRRAQQLEDEG